MAIRSIGAKALQQNKRGSASEAKSKSVATQSLESAFAVSDAIDSGTKVNSSLRTMRRWLAAGCLGLIAVGSSGCTMSAGLGRAVTHSDCIDDFMISYRNKAMAEKAWHCRKERFCNQCFSREFKDGFIQGYGEVAQSGNACTPAVAPSEYLGWRYQSSSGQGAINAWFQGFPEGARAAEEDGIGFWRQNSYIGSSPQAGALPSGVIQNGSAVPVIVEPAPANPFYSEQEFAPAPSSFGTPPASTNETVETFNGFDSAYHETSDDFPFAEVISDDKSLSTSGIRIANRGVDSEKPSSVTADSVTNGSSKSLPFSFE